MNTEIPCNPNDLYLIVEGPSWGDAEFLGKWLLAAHKANEHWQKAAESPEFAKEVERLQVVSLLDLSMAATCLLLELRGQFVAFLIRLDSDEGELFAMLAGMGFFARTGERYQMVIPARLTLATVKSALLRLAQTEDSKSELHPELLVSAIPFTRAQALFESLCDMDDDHR